MKYKLFNPKNKIFTILSIIIMIIYFTSIILTGCYKNVTQSSSLSSSLSSSISSSQSSEISESQNSGIEGVVLIGPLHPVEQISQINEAPYPDAIIIIRNKTSGEEIKRSFVDENGYFKIPLLPGDYILDAKNKTGSVMPISKPIDVTVLSNEFTHITVRFDSGIR
ncbi:MAG: hypothetical protein ACYCYI_03950 [Saccharofermentanales bacterium]